MPGPITSLDLLQQVRQQIDEQNTEAVADSDIYAALNRAQRKAFNTLAKHYPDLFVDFVLLTADQASYDTYPIPPKFFGRRLNSVYVIRSFIEYPLKRVEYNDLHKFTSSAQVRLPSVYAITGRNFIIKPQPQPGVQFKVWGMVAPETVVPPQGRITAPPNVAGNYIIVDSLGTGVTTDVPSLTGFVNVVDCQTGKIKATMQVQAISGTQVWFKSVSPTLTTVYGKTVALTLPTGNINPNDNANVNDYICAVQGTCVPDAPEACLDFYIQYAVNEIKRRLGEPVSDEKALLDELEADIEHQWSGREPIARIRNTARHWTR